MKPQSYPFSHRSRGFTLTEILIAMTISVSVLGMAMGIFLSGLRTMYKDTERLNTNSNLRSFMSQASKATLDASYFYIYPFYTALDGSVNTTSDLAPMTEIVNPNPLAAKEWSANGDCLVLITRTSTFRTSDLRRIRIYYRITTNSTERNSQKPLYYYETEDWGEGTETTSHGHSDEVAKLNLINLNANPRPVGAKEIALKAIGRKNPNFGGTYYPAFSSRSPTSLATSGYVSINLEFITGTTANNMLSSSSFNYTISPRR